MSYLYLLDTNIISELIKNPRGIIFSKIQEVGEDKICTSIIVPCESKFGAKKKNSQKLIDKLEIILESIEILPLTNPVEEYYAEIPYLFRKSRHSHWR
ncbi:PIN domain-containing protein [Dapis sp. BLCC M229]|uniref:PIN domain-containing protein n=1 Tax=Dapis sp. BLCC M229 TaxID=3400188 RepID=UPI003CEBB270